MCKKNNFDPISDDFGNKIPKCYSSEIFLLLKVLVFELLKLMPDRFFLHVKAIREKE